jgi:hypothetical protein
MNAIASLPRDEVAEKIKQEKEERTRAKRDRFSALFAEWLINRGEYIRPESDWSDENEPVFGRKWDQSI